MPEGGSHEKSKPAREGGAGDGDVLTVTSMASGGEGVGRLADGRVVFVEGGVPGDRIELTDLRVRKKLARARVGRLLEPSPDRVEPRCPSFGACGGCQWQHMRYAAQLEAKRRIISDALRRIGKIDLDHEIDIIGSPDEYAYRARARLVEGDQGVGYRRRASHDVETIEVCPILVPEAEKTVLRLSREVVAESEEASAPRREPHTSDSSKRRRRAPREWIVSAGTSGPAVVREIRSKRASREPLESIGIEVLGECLRASPTSFIQGNALLWDALAEEVRLQCTLPVDGISPERFVELYSGIGFFTLPLARQGLEGVAIESDRAALGDLARNLEAGGFAKRVEVLGGRIEKRGDLEGRFAAADVLLVDPPRIGLERSVLDMIASAGPAGLVYVSCDPATLARDLRLLVAAGYSIASVRALDLFPQTPHVETVVRLERVKARSGRVAAHSEPVPSPSGH